MKKNIILLGLVGLNVINLSYAEEGKTDKWKCKFCPYEDLSGVQGEVDFGFGYNTNDSYKYGDFTGLTEEGLYAIGNAAIRYGSEEHAGYFNVYANNIGLDSGDISIEGGKQGIFSVQFDFDQIAKFRSDTSRSPYTYDSGSQSFTLPVGWVAGADTTNFATLATDLQDINIDSTRRHFNIDADYILNKRVKLGINFQRQDKQGNRAIPASFGFTGSSGAVILAQPIDYITDKFSLFSEIKGDKWNAKLSYQLSNFKNDNNALAWQNAYTSPTSDGQMATEPDNKMQQFDLAARYNVSDKMFVHGNIAIGDMTQDEAFLPYTVNGALAAALPRNSLDGKINTFNVNLVGHYIASDKLRFKARYLQQEQDNKTARTSYDYVITDSAAAGAPRANFPFSFQNRMLSVDSKYKINKKSKVTGGLKYRSESRTYQEVDDSSSTGAWVKYANRINKKVELQGKVSLEKRSVDSYGTISELPTPENPLLRKFNIADRDRNQVSVTANSFPTDKLNVSLDIQYSADDYSDSQIGLTEATETTVSLDSGYQVSENLTTHGYLVLSTIKSSQAGSDAFAAADWFADNEDVINTLGIGAAYQVIEDKLRVELDYTFSDSSGSINMQGLTGFPDLTSTRHSIKLMGHYQLKEKIKLVVGYLHEDYKETDWSIDGVAPDTVSNVLGLGERSPEYSVGTFLTSIFYSIK